MDTTRAKDVYIGLQLGFHIAVQAWKVEQSEADLDAADELIRNVANGSETLVDSTVEIQRTHPNITPEHRRQMNEAMKEAAQLVIWWNNNATIQ
ncbi:MAG: hypothetical protein HYV60_20310 [Planctomycetia bacterium]|nr:hypothetical protein [Planctomycetia bacterium]